MKIEYLVFDLLIFISSTLGIFITKRSYPNLSSAIKSIVIVAVPFLIWDHLVTNIWWSFNNKYTLGLHILKLPVEEIMFFFTIPWSCLLIWINLKSKKIFQYFSPLRYPLLVVTLCFLLGSFVNNQVYLFFSLLSFLLVQLLGFRQKIFNHHTFLFFISLVLLLTTIFNGYLTSRPVVEYSSKYLSNIFIYTIPIEDYLYGLTLVSGTVIFYEHFLKKTSL